MTWAMTENKRPLVGVGVLVWFEGRVLLGRRRGAHGAESWSFPGGHLELGESWGDCARREVREETGLSLAAPRFAGVTNDIFDAHAKHYVTIFMEAQALSGDARRLEPDKCEGWSWFSWSALPAPLFLPITHLLASGYAPVSGR